MREVLVRSWCDECFNEDDARVEATSTFTVGVVSGELTHPPVKVLELCEVHTKRITDLMQLLAEVGTTPERKAPAAGPAKKAKVVRGNANELARPRVPGTIGLVETLDTNPMSECPVCQVELRMKSRVQHLYSHHLGGQQNRPQHPARCPECDFTNDNSAAMSMHRTAAHGWSAFLAAMELYEKRQAQLPAAKRGRPVKAQPVQPELTA